jgi:hypothetical protein
MMRGLIQTRPRPAKLSTQALGEIAEWGGSEYRALGGAKPLGA